MVHLSPDALECPRDGHGPSELRSSLSTHAHAHSDRLKVFFCNQRSDPENRQNFDRSIHVVVVFQEMGRTKIVMISEEEYDLLKTREELIRKGSESLPPDVRSDIEEHNRLGDLALGAIIGVGAVALLALLLGDND